MARPSFETICPSCDAPRPAPRKEAEERSEATLSCRCGFSGLAPTREIRKEKVAAKPRKGLRRGGPLRKSRKKSRSSLAARLARRWGAMVGDVCQNCGAKKDFTKGVFLEGHHIIRQALIRERGKEEGWTEEELDRRLWDLRNKMDLCRSCHLGGQHNGKPLKWEVVRRAAPKVEQFAREIGSMARAAREYR